MILCVSYVPDHFMGIFFCFLALFFIVSSCMTINSLAISFVLNYYFLGHRHFAVSLPRAAASDESSPFFTEQRDSVTVLEDSPSASSLTLEDSPPEEIPSDGIAATEVPKQEPVEDVPVVTLVEIATSEEPKEQPLEGAQEQAFEFLNDLKVRTFNEVM